MFRINSLLDFQRFSLTTGSNSLAKAPGFLATGSKLVFSFELNLRGLTQAKCNIVNKCNYLRVLVLITVTESEYLA